MRDHLFRFIAPAVLIGLMSGCIVRDRTGDPDDWGEGGGGTGQGASGGTGGSTGGGGTGGDTGGTGGTGGSGAGGQGGGASISACTSATLFAGNPYFNGDLEGWDPVKQPLLGATPLRSRHLAPAGGRVFMDTQYEVWVTNDTTATRVAGDELQTVQVEGLYQPSGPCADVRFISIDSLTTLPDGDVVVADIRGNGLVELHDPTGSCTAAPIAGNMQAVKDTDIPGDSAADAGDVDGPGASAKFWGVRLPTADAAGNVYVFDEGNAKIKKVAAGADHTVTTLHDFAGPTTYYVLSMTVMNGRLYVAGTTSINDFLWEIDTETGQTKTVYEKRGIFEELDSSMQAVLFAMTNDGEDLIVGSMQGYIWRLSPGGQSLGVLAGYGEGFEFPAGIDLSKPIAAGDLPLKSYAVNKGSLVRKGSSLLWAGGGGTGYHILDIACQ